MGCAAQPSLYVAVDNQHGGYAMTGSQRRYLGGLILIVLGILLILNNFDIDAWDYVWPLAIILFGVYLITRGRHRSNSQSRLSEFRVLGDSRHAGYTGEIDGADISHFIGDVELNLTGAQLKPGVNKLHVSMFIGDIRITIPAGMAVSASGSVAFGDVRIFDRKEEGIFLSVREKSSGYDSAEKKLHISCAAFIGDITITYMPLAASA
jgi:predicted membrane protein